MGNATMTIEQAVGIAVIEARDLPEPVQQALNQVEEVMYNAVNSDVTVLRDASHHILEAGGKRIRPRLTLLSFAAVGGMQFEDVAQVAAAVELVHTASVVHDDINDHGIVRRGRPSVNSIWGRTFALLTGDYLFTKVYELMAPHRDLNIILSEATTALVEGETLQASAVKDNNFSRKVYFDIIARKTAALFKAGGQLGATLGGGTSKQIEALGQFGYNIGLAFQMIDDVLDIVGTPEQLGKTSGIDIEQGRGFVVAYNGETHNGENGDPMASIKQKVLRGDTIKEAYQQAQHLAQLAIAQLSALPDSEAKSALIQLAESVVERSY
jgi:geranylgeranyl pyrophosphate synthase